MLRILTYTDLYPSEVQPRHGIFVEQRLRRMVATGRVSARVVAPVPWFPPGDMSLAGYRRFAAVPAKDTRNGIDVWYPRFATLPGLSNYLNPVVMAATSLPLLKRLQRAADFDLIDAQFLYPDAVAGVLLGGWLQKPVVMLARGSDVNLSTHERVPRAWIRWAAERAAALITVSSALRERLMAIGIPGDKITVLRNGVDLDLFRPLDAATVRRDLRVRGPLLLSVGNLVEEKGHQFVLAALRELAAVNAVIIGSGPWEQRLKAQARELGVADRVTWIAHVDQPRLAGFYAAADATVLASSREGMANVLLESLASGTPVVATRVGGTPEIIADPAAGVLIDEGSGAAVAAGWRSLEQARPTREMTRRYAEQFSWDLPVAGQIELFASVVAAAGGTASGRKPAHARRAELK